MVKHIILWKMKDSLNEGEKAKVKEDAKRELEGLVGKIDGLRVIRVEIKSLSSSNADLMLYSEFDDEASLHSYAVNPLHNAVADTYVRPFMAQRLCLDFDTTEA